MKVSALELKRLALSASRSSTSRVLGAATGIDSQQICAARRFRNVERLRDRAVAGNIERRSVRHDAGRRGARANLLCWARSRSISRYEKPHG